MEHTEQSKLVFAETASSDPASSDPHWCYKQNKLNEYFVSPNIL